MSKKSFLVSQKCPRVSPKCPRVSRKPPRIRHMSKKRHRVSPKCTRVSPKSLGAPGMSNKCCRVSEKRPRVSTKPRGAELRVVFVAVCFSVETKYQHNKVENYSNIRKNTQRGPKFAQWPNSCQEECYEAVRYEASKGYNTMSLFAAC